MIEKPWLSLTSRSFDFRVKVLLPREMLEKGGMVDTTTPILDATKLSNIGKYTSYCCV